MPNPQLVCDGTPGLFEAFILQAQNNSGSPFAAAGSAIIDRYDLAFLSAAGGNAFQIIPKITMTPDQATKTVTATFNLTDTASGVSLPSISVAVDLVAPPPAPGQLATHVVLTGGPTGGTGSSLTDPGNATISVSLT